MAQSGQYILQRLALPAVHVNLTGGHDRAPELVGEPSDPGQALFLVCLQGAAGGNPETVMEPLLQPFAAGQGLLGVRTGEGRWLPEAQAVIQTVAVEVVAMQLVLPLVGPPATGGDQAAQLAVSLAGAGEQNETGAGLAGGGIRQLEPAAGNQLDRLRFQGGPGPGYARHRTGVGDG